MKRKTNKSPSLENLLENVDIGLEILHPGGLEITRELAHLCHVGAGARVLDVASGTGESGCFLAEHFGCSLIGLDASDAMVEKARIKAEIRGIPVEFKKGDAHDLPFPDNVFDAVISECTMCILDKEKAIREMVRVTRKGGYVGIHDLCWKEATPEQVKQRLSDIERERPETLDGWKSLFERERLHDVTAMDRSYLMPVWKKEVNDRIGIVKRLEIALIVIKKWGIGGYRTIAGSERILRGIHTGYGIIVGRKA
jgi:arsenite methyltransferase